MSQTTLEDELFSEAASELREDVEAALADARSALPDPEAVWAVQADNTLGVLNGLRTGLEVEAADEQLTEAKKWYTMGERADAFEDAEALGEEIEEVEALFERLETVRGQAGELAAALPELKSALEAAHATAED